ncbi:hypothetical protein [Priestia megaterium]|uniref:hypothetical protein n=1 Tax=Priestia megaterium TaxID=1404 RepID=UPI001D798F66|nr:hypothetical protein [Priestia megaterium]CAH0325049.1 hypothetical protein SRABI82_05981 [Priestia megaterium]
MRKLYAFLIGILLLISLFGCQNEKKSPLDFTGKGEHWSANVTVYPGEDKEETKKINLNYTDDDPRSVKDLEFKLDSQNGQLVMGEANVELDKNGGLEEKSNTKVSKQTTNSDEFVLTIKWNNQSEDIVLKNK